MYAGLSTVIVCAQKRAKYALGEPKLDVKDMYVKEILSHLLADAEARSLVSDSFPKMHMNNKINVSVKAMCRVAAKQLLNKALQICREHAGSLLQAARLVKAWNSLIRMISVTVAIWQGLSLSFMILHTSLSKKSMRCQ